MTASGKQTISTILAIAKVVTAAAITASATYVVAEVVAKQVPLTPIEIVQQSKSGSAITSTAAGADAIRKCSEPATEGSSDLCVTVDGLIVDPSRALIATGDALREALNSGDAIAEAIRDGKDDVAAAPLSTGPNGRTPQS